MRGTQNDHGEEKVPSDDLPFALSYDRRPSLLRPTTWLRNQHRLLSSARTPLQLRFCPPSDSSDGLASSRGRLMRTGRLRVACSCRERSVCRDTVQNRHARRPERPSTRPGRPQSTPAEDAPADASLPPRASSVLLLGHTFCSRCTRSVTATLLDSC